MKHRTDPGYRRFMFCLFLAACVIVLAAASKACGL